jgi:hypothetical protein
MPRVSLDDVADLVDKRLSAEESAVVVAEGLMGSRCQRRFRLRGYVVVHVDFFFRFAIQAAEALPNGDLKWTFELRHPRYVRCAPVRIHQVDSRGRVMDSALAAARAGTAVRGLA